MPPKQVAGMVRRNSASSTLRKSRAPVPLPGDVPGSVGVLPLMAQLVDLVDIADALLRQLPPALGGIHEAHQDALHVLPPRSRPGRRWEQIGSGMNGTDLSTMIAKLMGYVGREADLNRSTSPYPS
jgi:hypothetical protein